jgi:hypothetical protein
MEHLADFRGLSALIGGVLALIVIGIVVARFLRKQQPPAPESPADLPLEDTDPGFLDSSHIFTRPMPGAKDRTPRSDGGAAGRSGGGSGSGTGRGGST